MKFKNYTDHPHWTKEQTEQRIEFVNEEIGIFNKEINKINDRISALIEEKMIIRRKISDKQKYINQLEEQLKEIEWNE